jgi:hypothetical protein
MKKTFGLAACAGACILATLPGFADVPEMTAEYVGKARYVWENTTVDSTMRAKGSTLRIDMTAASLKAETGTSIIMDFDARRFISFATGKLPPEMRVYMVINNPDMPATSELAVPVGTETVAGMTCTNYEFVEQTETGEIEAFRNCITSDGIWLKSTDGSGKVVFVMTEVTRSPQPAALFQPPPGYTEMNLDSFGGFDLSQFTGGGSGNDDASEKTPSYGEKKVDEAKDETARQVEERVDEERRKNVDKFLGKIFGN